MPKKKNKPWLSRLGIALFIPSLLLNLFYATRPTSDYGIQVLEVLDGDTLLLDGKAILRQSLAINHTLSFDYLF